MCWELIKGDGVDSKYSDIMLDNKIATEEINMAYEFGINMLKLTSNRRKMLVDGESLIKAERVNLNVRE